MIDLHLSLCRRSSNDAAREFRFATFRATRYNECAPMKTPSFARSILVALAFAFGAISSPTSASAQDAKVATSAVDLLQGGDLTKHWTTTGNWKLGPDGVATLTPRPG